MKTKDLKYYIIGCLLLAAMVILLTLIPNWIRDKSSPNPKEIVFSFDEKGVKYSISYYQIQDSISKHNQQVGEINGALNSNQAKESKRLRDSLNSIKNVLNELASEEQYLADKMAGFYKLTGVEKDSLMTEIYNYLSNERSDYHWGLEAMEIVDATNKEQIKLLASDTTKKGIRIIQLLSENLNLSDSIKGLEDSLSHSLTLNLAQMIEIEKLKKDTSSLGKRLTDLFRDYEKLVKDYQDVTPLRIRNLTFHPKGVPTRKDGTYKSWRLKQGLDVCFTIDQNRKIEDSSVELLIVYSIPGMAEKEEQYVWANINQMFCTLYPGELNKNIGLYIVQIFVKKDDEMIPLGFQTFEALPAFQKDEAKTSLILSKL